MTIPTFDGMTLLGNWNKPREPRIGIMLHFDGSVTDKGGLAWMREDTRCKVSYNWAITDAGGIATIAPMDARAWHAGVCRPSDPRLRYTDANSAFYGISLLATVGDTATAGQIERIVELCRGLYDFHRWDRSETWRIVGHASEAWPRGRKNDPIGPDPAHPVLDPDLIRRRL